MNRILVAASLALLVGTSSFVSAHAAMAELKPYTFDAAVDMRTSDLVGQRIYATTTDVEGRTLSQTELAEFDDIGEINDVIVSPDGQVKAVVLGIGGFLGLGESDVTLDMSSLRFVQETPIEGAPASSQPNSFIVVNADKERLTALAETQKAEMAAADEAMRAQQAAEAATAEVAATAAGAADATGEAVADATDATAKTVAEAGEKVEALADDAAEAVTTETAETTTTETTVPVETVEADGTQVTTTQSTETAAAETATAETPVTQAPAADAGTDVAAAPAPAAAASEREILVRPQVVTEGYEDIASTEMTADTLTGARVYGVDGEDIGEVAELVLGSDGSTIERAVLDVGGFLGIGERKVAVPLDELQFTRNADGDTRIYIQATQAQLEAQPEYVAD